MLFKEPSAASTLPNPRNSPTQDPWAKAFRASKIDLLSCQVPWGIRGNSVERFYPFPTLLRGDDDDDGDGDSGGDDDVVVVDDDDGDGTE